LVKITFARSVSIAFGLDSYDVPGRDAEVAGLGIDRAEMAVGARLDPRDVVADGRDLPALEAGRRDQHREVGLAARARERRGDVALVARGRGHAEDQHVLGEPAFVAPHDRRDAQREAFLAEQRVAAVARAVRPDLARLGEMHDVLVLGVARPALVRSPRSSGAPTECTHGTNAPSAPSASTTARPMRAMMRMLTTTYGLSVISTPICAIGLPIGPIENGTTYIVRPRIAPSNNESSVSRISRGARQLLVGPASSSRSLQMNVRSSTRATSDGDERAR
jgi:hypothetical protein